MLHRKGFTHQSETLWLQKEEGGTHSGVKKWAGILGQNRKPDDYRTEGPEQSKAQSQQVICRYEK